VKWFPSTPSVEMTDPAEALLDDRATVAEPVGKTRPSIAVAAHTIGNGIQSQVRESPKHGIRLSLMSFPLP
jgi:hypothetical protein